MSDIKAKLQQKLKAMKDKQAQSSSQQQPPQQQMPDTVEQFNKLRMEQFLQTKENQNKYLDKTREEIENLKNILTQENIDKKAKDLADIEMEMKRCEILIRESRMDLIIEIQELWSHFKTKEKFENIQFKKQFFFDNIEQFDRELLFNYMYKSALYEAFQNLSVDRWKIFQSVFSKNQQKEIANNNKLYIRYLILLEYHKEFEKRFQQGNLGWRTEFKETNNLIDNLLGFKTFVDEEDLANILTKKIAKKEKTEIQVIDRDQRRFKAIEWTPEELFYLNELLTYADENGLRHYNLKKSPMVMIFIGHVDSGKSTICGQMLIQSGQVNEMEIQKLKQEAEAQGRGGWWAAYLMDLNEEEREKGITVDVGRAYFETEKRRFTILDCPGHKNYIQNMIEGASQADVAVLIVSARTGEFEAGFEKSGQTREHAMLARALGAERIIVVINKMDYCDWSEERYNYIKDQLYTFLRKSCGFESDKIFFSGIEGLSAINIKDPVTLEKASWYKDYTLFEALDRVPFISRSSTQILRMPIQTKQMNGGEIELFGKIEVGIIKQGMKCTLLPTQEKCLISAIMDENDQPIYFANSGENVKIQIKNANYDDIRKGDILCGSQYWTLECQEFVAQIKLFELPNEILLSKGFEFSLHSHSLVEEGEIAHIFEKTSFDNNTGNNVVIKKPKLLKSFDEARVVIKMMRPICIEKYEHVPELGRFTIRSNQYTIGSGEITMLKPVNKELLKSNYYFKGKQ